MRSHRVPVALAVFFAVAIPIAAQTPDIRPLADSLDELLSGVLRMNIRARIVDPTSTEESWAMDVTRVTISGRSVRVRMEGANITVIADFTPYWEDNDELLLVAQGQTWIFDPSGNQEARHRTSFTTMPMRLGEPLIFLPLGSSMDEEQIGLLNIELEINVERYQS